MPTFDANVFDSGAFDALAPTYTIDFTAGVYAQTGNNLGLSYSGDTANYTIVVSAGSYLQTGNAIALSKAFNLAFTAGVYAQTGNTIGLSKGVELNFSAGVYAQTGNAVALTKNFQLNFTAGVYSQTGSDFELLAAQSETFYLNFIIDLLPVQSGANLFGQRLTVDGNVLKVKSWVYDESEQDAAARLDVELANVDNRSLITKDADITFEITRDGTNWIQLLGTGYLSRTDYALSRQGIGALDSFTFSGLSEMNALLDSVPSNNLIIYNPSRHDITEDSLEGITERDGTYVPPEVVAVNGLTLYSLFNEIFVSRCGFTAVNRNIPDFEIAIADFPIGRSYTNTIGGIIGMFKPDYSAIGTTLYIRDGQSGTPAGFPAPRQITVSQSSSLGVSAAHNRFDAIEVSIAQERFTFDYYTDRQETIITETGDNPPFPTEAVETTVTTTYRDYFRASNTNIPAKTEIRARTTTVSRGVTDISQVTETFTYDNMARLTRRTMDTETLLPDPLNDFGLLLIDASEEVETVTYAMHPYQPNHYYIASREINKAGLVYIDAENQQLGEDFVREAPLVYEDGNVTDTMTSDWVKISTFKETITPQRNKKVRILTEDVNYLANQYRTTEETRDGEVGVNIFVIEQKKIVLYSAGSCTEGILSLNAGELPQDLAIALGFRILANEAVQPNRVSLTVIGLDNTLQKGQPVNARGRGGEDLGNYIIEARRLEGSERGYFTVLTCRQSE